MKKNVIILLKRALLMTCLIMYSPSRLSNRHTLFIIEKIFFRLWDNQCLWIISHLLTVIFHCSFPGQVIQQTHLFTFRGWKKNLASVINHKTAFFVNCLNFAYPATIFHFSLLNFHLLLWVYFIDTYLIVFLGIEILWLIYKSDMLVNIFI